MDKKSQSLDGSLHGDNTICPTRPIHPNHVRKRFSEAEKFLSPIDTPAFHRARGIYLLISHKCVLLHHQQQHDVLRQMICSIRIFAPAGPLLDFVRLWLRDWPKLTGSFRDRIDARPTRPLAAAAVSIWIAPAEIRFIIGLESNTPPYLLTKHSSTYRRGSDQQKRSLHISCED